MQRRRSQLILPRVLVNVRFGARNQFEVAVPIAFQQSTTGGWSRGLGDVALAVKRVLFHSFDTGTILSAAGELVLPTGKEDKGLGRGVTIFEPYVALGQILPSDSFVQVQAGLELPTNRERASNEAFWRAAYGRTFMEGRFGRAWTPMIELLGVRELTGTGSTDWDVAPQIQVSLSRRQHVLLNVGLQIPVNRRGERGYRSDSCRTSMRWRPVLPNRWRTPRRRCADAPVGRVAVGPARCSCVLRPRCLRVPDQESARTRIGHHLRGSSSRSGGALSMTRSRHARPAASQRLTRRTFVSCTASAFALVLGRDRWPATSAAPRSEPEFASALDVARLIRTRAVSSLEVTRLTLRRIERWNPLVNAVVTVSEGKALERARAADAALGRGDVWGPFHGVPWLVKDTFETAGIRSTAGSHGFRDYVPKVDAAVVERMHRAGAVILGKTNVPEMGYDWQSYNDVFGVTRNPWNPARTAGGSSGGSAAALAAGLGYLSVGSDLGGSIRIPAHFCGIYGHKPTARLVPMRGHSPFVPGQSSEPPVVVSVAGPMSRSAEDLAAALDIMRGRDAGGALATPRAARLSGYRVGYVLDHALCPVTPAVGDVLRRVVDLIGRHAKSTEHGWPEGIDPAVQLRGYDVLRDAALAAMSSTSSRVLASRGRRDATPRWRAPSKEATQEANRARLAAQEAWRRYFTTHDVFVLPTAFIPAFEHDASLPMTRRILETPAGPRNYVDLRFWIACASFSGNPATTAPAGLARDGLPVGVQIIGPYLEDRTPIDFARHLAALIGGFVPPPCCSSR